MGTPTAATLEANFRKYCDDGPVHVTDADIMQVGSAVVAAIDRNAAVTKRLAVAVEKLVAHLSQPEAP